MSYNHFTTGHLGLAAILAAILNISNCSKLIFTPPTENDPWDPYLDESSEKKTLTEKKGFTSISPWLGVSIVVTQFLEGGEHFFGWPFSFFDNLYHLNADRSFWQSNIVACGI